MKQYWKKLSIRGKLFTLGIALVTMIAALFFIVFIPFIRGSITDKKKDNVRELTEAAHSVIEYYSSRNIKGELTVEEAKQLAVDTVGSMRYGRESKDYFWITDLHPKMIYHPYKTDLNGTDLSAYKDPDGKNLFVEMAEVCRTNGAGFVEYKWQLHENSTRLLPKISYVMTFRPWGWIVGTGIYLHDVDAEMDSLIMNAAAMFAVIYIVALIVLALFLNSITSPVKKIVKLASEVSHGKLGSVLAQNHYRRCSEMMNCGKPDCPAYSSPGLDCWRIEGTTCDSLAGCTNDEQKKAVCENCIVYKSSVRNEIDQLIEAVNYMIVTNRSILSDMTGVIQTIDESAASLRVRIDDEAKSINQQMASIEETSSAMEELAKISESIDSEAGAVTAKVRRSADISAASMSDISELAAIIEKLKNAYALSFTEIAVLGDKSKNINTVLEGIDSIASQTKLIAFNATIEAAASGELGMRFSVVADEIRRLADSVSRETGEITSQIREIQGMILGLTESSGRISSTFERAVASSERTSAAFREVLTVSEESFSLIDNISDSISQQKSATEQVLAAARDSAENSSQISANIMAIADQIRRFEELSSMMKKITSRFEL